jgi:hypothetical protein
LASSTLRELGKIILPFTKIFPDQILTHTVGIALNVLSVDLYRSYSKKRSLRDLTLKDWHLPSRIVKEAVEIVAIWLLLLLFIYFVHFFIFETFGKVLLLYLINALNTHTFIHSIFDNICVLFQLIKCFNKNLEEDFFFKKCRIKYWLIQLKPLFDIRLVIFEHLFYWKSFFCLISFKWIIKVKTILF